MGSKTRPFRALFRSWAQLGVNFSQQSANRPFFLFVCLFVSSHNTRFVREQGLPFIPLIKCHEDGLVLFFFVFVFLYVFSQEKSSLLLRPANSQARGARAGQKIDHTSETQDESLDQDEDEIIVCCPRRGARSRLRRFKRGREDQARALQAVSGPVGRKPVVAF